MSSSQKRAIPYPLKKILEWDKKITYNILNLFTKNFGPISRHETTLKTLELSGHGMIWIVVCCILIYAAGSFSVKHIAINILIAQTLDLIVVSIVKAIARRRRPAPVTDDRFTIQAVDKFSFPSGHASKTALVTTLITIQYDLGLVADSVLYCWFIAVCVSRLLKKRHYLLDVLAGVLIGWLEAVFVSYSGLWLSQESASTFLSYVLDESAEGASYHV